MDGLKPILRLTHRGDRTTSEVGASGRTPLRKSILFGKIDIKWFSSHPKENDLKNLIEEVFSPHHRRSIRLPGYDYSSPGGYFLTITTFSREPIFGSIIDGEMVLSPFGAIAQEEWLKTPIIRKEIELGNFAIMPDHIHMVFWIRDDQTAPSVGASGRTPLPFRLHPRSVGALVAGYKSVVTKRINQERDTAGLPVWQRNYYEHIIRDDKDLIVINRYIENNPLTWLQGDEW